MGLDLTPRRGDRPLDNPPGMTHKDSEPCPFADDKNPIGVFGTCCSYRGNACALYCIGIGLGGLAIALYEDKTPEEAIAFATAIRGAVTKFNEVQADAFKRAGVAAGERDKAEAEVPDVNWRFSLSKAVSELQQTAKWFEKVGKLGYSVHPWF